MSAVRPGDIVAGKYRIERVLGSGGMGYVVAARHLQLDQMVAMKFLKEGALEEGEAATRFLREAKAVVKLRNEHVARVSDVGTLETGEPYIVMEHLDGCDLSALAKKQGQISVYEACDYVLQACEALAEAHALGIVHRDIKLANLFVTRGPTGAPLLKVLDFGISKASPFGESEHEVTRTASMLGSPRFMSPEQMRDPRAVDGRSDIWSLGVVLYRLVAGKPPFEAETLGRLLTMVMHEQPTLLSSVRSDLPAGFEQAVARCLEKEPAHRYANVAEFAYALVPFANDPIRARGAADRIAAMLSAGHRSELPVSPASAGRRSSPPGASDTAAPWTGGPRTSAVPPPPARSTLAWATVGLFVLLVGTALFVKVRHDRAYGDIPPVDNAGDVAPPVMTSTPVVAAPVVVAPPPVAAEPAAEPSTTAKSAPPVASSAPSTARPPVTRPAEPRRAWVPARRPPPRQGGGPDGIPATRE